MNERGTVVLEALIASGLVLMLLMVLASLMILFWQYWHKDIQSTRERQWTTLAFEHLDRDIRGASRVMLTRNDMRITLADGIYIYRVSTDNSFHRSLGNTHYALAIVDSVTWWWEGNLLWIELNYRGESYRCCYYIPPDKR